MWKGVEICVDNFNSHSRYRKKNHLYRKKKKKISYKRYILSSLKLEIWIIGCIKKKIEFSNILKWTKIFINIENVLINIIIYRYISVSIIIYNNILSYLKIFSIKIIVKKFIKLYLALCFNLRLCQYRYLCFSTCSILFY